MEDSANNGDSGVDASKEGMTISTDIISDGKERVKEVGFTDYDEEGQQYKTNVATDNLF
jgi:hypothetical protein